MISVIVPIYKVESFLERCVTSIINQTYKNFEIILVDDESPDNCPKICDEFAMHDKRIKVIHKKNGGLSDARNAGLALASGEYVLFVDSDDFIERDMLRKMHVAIIRSGADIVCCNYKTVDELGATIELGAKEKIEYRRIINGADYCEKYLLAHAINNIWNKLFRRAVLSGQLFVKGIYAEDYVYMLNLLQVNTKIYCIRDALYNYTKRGGSITSGFNEKFYLDCVKNSFICEEIVKERFSDMDIYIKSSQLLMLRWFLSEMPYEFLTDSKDSYQFVLEKLSTVKKHIVFSKIPIIPKNSLKGCGGYCEVI